MSGDLFDLLAAPPSRDALASVSAPLSQAGNIAPVAERPTRGRVRRVFRVFDGEQGREVTLVGRTAWALANLVHAGPNGCTPITTPGPRWSDYVFKLRRDHGINVETVDEAHGGPYSGTHARYVLRQRVEFVADESEAL